MSFEQKALSSLLKAQGFSYYTSLSQFPANMGRDAGWHPARRQKLCLSLDNPNFHPNF
jgi:hypothetical protein